jgi:DNA-binding CsgD family transcriptional regulator
MVALAEERLALYRELQDRRGMAGALGQLGHALWHQQEFPSARARLTEALALLQELEHDPALWNPFMSITHVLWSLGNVARDQGDQAAAHAFYAEGMAAAQEQGSAFHVSVLLDGFASLAAAAGQAAQAARLLGAAEAVREASEVSLAPVYHRDFYDAFLATVHASLDAGTLAAAWAAGRAMPLEAAIEEALATPAGIAAPASAARPVGIERPAGLTTREAEVLRHVAAGETDRQIAAALVISEKTVGRHLDNLYAKLGISSRAAATAFALRHNLA